MRKNLFLTLALVLASFAGAFAQNWSVTLGGTEGLPGETVTKDGGNLTYFKSGIIRADKPIKTLRFTCAGNSTSNKPNGNNYRLMLSELNVYTADMSKELAYTVTSNADHNTLTKSFDGQGLRALYDGKYNNYFTSMSAEVGAVTEYHYLELTFEEEIDRFIIEWGGKQGAGEAPSVVGLTEGGVDFEPYTDRSSSFGDEKITTLEELVAAEYFVIRGNAPTSYNTYNNQTGELTSKDGELEGVGPMYVTCGNITAEEPTIDYLAKLIPVPGKTGKYYVFFTQQQKYLNGNASDNGLNDAFNGWQYATIYQDKAAEVSFNVLDNGDFEMYYTTEKDGEEYDVYIAADPRTSEQLQGAVAGKMKIFTPEKKRQLEANGWCQGFALVCAFNWSFYPAEYYAPSWAKEYELGKLYIAAKELQSAFAGYTLPATEDYKNVDAETYAEERDNIIANLNSVITELEDALADVDEMDEDKIQDIISKQEEVIGEDIIYEIAYLEDDEFSSTWMFWSNNSSTAVQNGKWSFDAYENYIKPGQELIEEINDADEFFDYIDEVTEYFTNKTNNETIFLASKFKEGSFNLEYTSEKQLGELVDDKYYLWEQAVSLGKEVDGIRITFKETNGGAGANFYNGFAVVALGELEIYNGTEKVALQAADCATNSQETSEGPITNLVDGDQTKFWHSIWGNGTMNPIGDVYLDIAFPVGVSLKDFTVKLYSRNKALAPKTVVISDLTPEEKVNIYNVTKGAKITDLANLRDGGLYLLQGNLDVNKSEDAAEPRYYAGASAAGSDDEAINENCVYMFKKVGDAWNILSLSKAKYWIDAPEYGAENLNEFKVKAGNVKIEKSNNIENAWVIYTPIDSILSSNYEHPVSETDTIKFDSVGVNVKALVYMDWAAGLASRPCYSALPGEADPRFTALTDELKVSGVCGDYLHFNKTNGEGEWCIYEVTMENADFLYLKGLTEVADNPNFVPGDRPGCIKADAELTAEFNNAKAAAEVAVEEEKTENAQALANALATAIDKFGTAERIGFDPEMAYEIQSAYPGYIEKTWYTRSIYYMSEDAILRWTITPENIKDRAEFLFQIVEIDEEYAITNNLTVPEGQYGMAFTIKNLGKNQFVIADWGTGNRPAIHTIENIEANQYYIKTNGKWHTQGHNNGWGYAGEVVNWEGLANSCSSWTFVPVAEISNVQVAVEDVLVEGDEVVSVNYYTPAGVAVAEPVKGINIVVTVYANGVVEAKKVLVK